jgi:acyl carrier protein
MRLLRRLGTLASAAAAKDGAVIAVMMTYKALSHLDFARGGMSVSRDNVLDVIAEESLVERSALAPDATLESLGIQSLDIISIVFALEDKFGIVLEQSEFEGVATVAQLVDIIVDKANAAGGAGPAEGEPAAKT